jgi:hypothetical protein
VSADCEHGTGQKLSKGGTDIVFAVLKTVEEMFGVVVIELEKTGKGLAIGRSYGKFERVCIS